MKVQNITGVIHVSFVIHSYCLLYEIDDLDVTIKRKQKLYHRGNTSQTKFFLIDNASS